MAKKQLTLSRVVIDFDPKIDSGYTKIRAQFVGKYPCKVWEKTESEKFNSFWGVGTVGKVVADMLKEEK